MKVAIDVGGTFTDIVTIDNGQVSVGKTPTTPHKISDGFLAAVELAGEPLAHVDELVHGTTVVLNALLTHAVPRTAVVTTEGFRDVLEIMRADRKDLFDLRQKKPAPLVPRDRRLEINERIAADGTVIKALESADLDRLVSELKALEVDAVAVCLLFAFVEPTHEIRIGKAIAAALPNAHVSLSHQVLPLYREYERTATTVVNAAAQPVMAAYLADVLAALRLLNFGGEFYVMQSNGGLATPAETSDRPVFSLFSGPAGGVVSAAEFGRRHDISNLLSLDMGGTSSDVAAVSDGKPDRVIGIEIGGYPIAVPSLDIVSVGAGGGSIAWLDDGGMLRVGPQSAGAEPGPACYGKGGQEFTVTDALVTMGLIRPDMFLGGEMTLDIQASLDAAGALCAKLDLTAEELAESVFQINLSSVTRAMRLVSVERGYDPRDYTLCAFGGGGPLHAALVAEDLGVDEVIVPPHAGLFSAYGLLVADFRRDYVLTEPTPLRGASPDRIREILDQLRRDADAEFEGMGIDPGGLAVNYSAEMRYVGQGHDLNVPFTESDLETAELGALKGAFDQVHKEKYGHSFPEDAAEFVSFRARALKYREKPELREQKGSSGSLMQETQGTVVWKGQTSEMQFLDRRILATDSSIEGPAVIVEGTSTTLVPPGWRAGADALGNLYMRRVGA